MTEQQHGAYQDLVESEPTHASASEATPWIDMHQRLIAMMERQLTETREFAQKVPEPMRQYLSRANIAILSEEIEAFKDRLDHWKRLRESQ